VRARSLKPSLFKNELLGAADPLLTVLFAGLWCEADREGRLEDRPARIRAEVFPYRGNLDIDTHLQWLHLNAFIRRYEAKGLKIIQILKFTEHQRPHKNEVESVLPTLDQASTTKVRRTSNQGRKSAQPNTQALRSDSGLLTPSSLTPDSGLLTPDCMILPSEVMSDSKPSDDVQTVFDHWRKVWNHPKSHLDPKRRAQILKALKGYSAADLCACISGYTHSAFHTGANDSQSIFDDLCLFLRDSSHIDKGIQLHANPPVLTSKLEQHNVAVLQAWRPKEMRDADSGLSEVSGSDGELERDVWQGALAAPH
jgi:hypothetical protein